MKKMIRSLFLATMALALVGTVDANAASSVSSRSFSSSTSSFSKPTYIAPSTSFSKPTISSPSPSTYSKPVTSSPVTAPTTTTNGFSKPVVSTTPTTQPPASSFSKPGGTPAPVATAPAVKPNSVLGTAANKQISSDSLKNYQAERANAKTPPAPPNVADVKSNPSYNTVRSQYKSTDDYMTQRNVQINIYRSSHPDVFVYSHNMYSYYGVYDNSFLLGMTLGYIGSSAANNAWLYAHYNDPWYIQWHADMMRQAANDDALRMKLEMQDQQIAALKAQNAAITNTPALPAGVNSSVAIAPEVMLATTDDQAQGGIGFLGWTLIILVIGVLGAGGYFYIVGSRR